MLFLDKMEIVRINDREVVLVGKVVHGMPCVVLDDLWQRLPYLRLEANNFSDRIDSDELELQNDCIGYCNNGALIEDHKRVLFTWS